MLMALADNELHGPEAEALRARIAADPVLAARYAVFAETRAALAAAFAPGPTPDRLTQAILAAPPQADMATGAGKVVAFRPRQWAGPAPLALAASLLLAVGVGGFLAGRALQPGAVPADPGALAAAALADQVTGSEAALPDGGSARVLGSYQTAQGLCRMIDLALPGDRAERAVVCRDDAAQGAGWSVVAAISAGPVEAYVPASDMAAELMDQVLNDLGAGPALAPEDEAAALAATP
jgi:hypothetical protein